MFGKVWDVLQKFYGRVLRPFVEWSWRNIVKLHDWLKRTLSPLFTFLDALRRDVLKIYNRWLRPILDTIDTVRQVARLLAEFHVPFARKIDDALADLEARLMRPIRLALSKINELIYWMDRVVDFNGLFQRLTLIESAITYERDMWRVWWLSVSNREKERTPASRDNTVLTRTPGEVSEQTRVYVVRHEGADAARIDEAVQDVRIRIGVP